MWDGVIRGSSGKGKEAEGRGTVGTEEEGRECGQG